MSNLNILNVIRDDLCTSCGTCVALCPRNAISMTVKEGIYLPSLDQKICNNCSMCYKVCPGHGLNYTKLNIELFGKKPENIISGNYLDCYVAYSQDNKVRFDSSSGGIVTELLIFALKNDIIDGALVTKMRDENPLEPEPFVARTRKEIIESSKSKYCPVPANIALKEILNSGPSDKFAVVGLPCHIHGIRKAEKLNKDLKRKIVLHIGLWCSGTCNFHGTSFLLKKLGITDVEVKKIHYRGNGWPGSLKIITKDKNEIIMALGKYYDSNFMSFISSRCRLCTDCNAELADISMGDYRGNYAYQKEKYGKTAIISRTQLADNILKQMNRFQEIDIKKTTFEDISSLQSYFYSKKKVEARFKIFKLFGKKIPEYNQELIKPSVSTYILDISIQISLYLASKNYLRVLIIYNKIINNIINRFIL
jgi:coenzyme F420 hydrogenase subunit beta